MSTQHFHSPAFHISNIEEFLHTVEARFGGRITEVGKSSCFEAHGNSLVLPDVTLMSAASNCGLSVDYPGFDCARLSISVKGSGSMRIGSEEVEINAAQTCIASFDRPSTVNLEAEHDLINLRIGRSAIERGLTAMLGAKPNRALDCEPTGSFRNPRLNGLRELMNLLASRWNSTNIEYPPQALHELEQVIVTMFLLGTRHQFSAVLERNPSDGSLSQLDRIEAYIEAHWDQPVRIDTLVELSGLNARAIFRLFQRVRGYSPMAFAKMVRLRRAKEMLTAPHDSATVSQIAFRCGFSNHGHFARDYHHTFSELPSATLLRARHKRG
jgi:AraC-like DNA-binding protein